MNVRVDDVSIEFGGVRVLEDVSLSVDSGTFLGIVGPNGAGKTTLIRLVNAVLSPDGGEVRVGGDRIDDLAAKAASRRVATVPQETHLSFDFDVRTVVEMGRHPHRDRFGREDDEGIVDQALERAAIANLADRSITEVSGGERQRVLLARSLAQNAPVLLLDEPTASLDINHQVHTLELVRDLAEAGRTVVAAIHDLDLAARFCDELALLHEGSIRSRGEPADVLTDDALEAAFDTPVAIDRNRVTGSLSVTALTDDEGHESPPSHGESDVPATE